MSLRYRTLGNYMAVNVMRWISRRVSLAHALARNPNEYLPAIESLASTRGLRGFGDS